MSKGFGLQFLNGVGEAQDQTVIKTFDFENKAFITDEDFTVEEVEDGNASASASGKEINTEEYNCNCQKCKHFLIFVAGALTGIVLKKLFGEDEKKEKEEKKNGTEV